MKHCVILTEADWRSLVPELARYLEREARKPGGFRIIDKETGKEIDDRLGDWLCGELQLAMINWEKQHLESNP